MGTLHIPASSKAARAAGHEAAAAAAALAQAVNLAKERGVS